MKSISNFIIVSIMAATGALTGCAVTSGPGAGYGANYSPVVDMKDVDYGKHQADLAQCRAFAQQIDASGNAVTGALGGAVFGGLLSAAVGGHSRANGYSAAGGAILGAAAAGGEAASRQAGVVSRCMAGRGYRVLG